MARKLLKSPDYRTFLKTIFEERRSRNSQYSFRAFARSLKTSHSFLSEVVNGKKKLSLAKAKVIVAKLELNPSEEVFFMDLVRGFKDRRLSDGFEIGGKNLANPSLFSEWYLPVILSLGSVPNFQLSAESASKAIGISTALCEQGIQALIKVGLLESNGRGVYLKKKDVWYSDALQEGAMRRYNEQVLANARDFVRGKDVADGTVCSLTFSMSKQQFQKLDEKLHSLLYEVIREAKNSSSEQDYDTVYTITGMLIPVARTS